MARKKQKGSKPRSYKFRKESKKAISKRTKEAGRLGGIRKHQKQVLELLNDDKKFAKLQFKWYEKLKESGFDDIEWSDPTTGAGQNSSYLKNSRNGVNARLDPNKELYYTMCRNWLTHAGPKLKIDRLMFELHTEGAGYRDIVNKVKRKLKQRCSHTAIFMRMKPLIAEMLKWNESDPRGVIKSREAQDFEIDLYANTIWQKEN